jgi:tetratricopeptide (TPR) repeat protein
MALGTVAQLRGDAAGAAARYEEALSMGTARQYALRNLGYLALEVGRTAEAAARFRAALEDTWSRRADSAVLEQLCAFAALARARGQWERAVRLVGAADAGLERLGGGTDRTDWPAGAGADARDGAGANGRAGLPDRPYRREGAEPGASRRRGASRIALRGALLERRRERCPVTATAGGSGQDRTRRRKIGLVEAQPARNLLGTAASDVRDAGAVAVPSAAPAPAACPGRKGQWQVTSRRDALPGHV